MTAQRDVNALKWGFSTLGCPELSLPDVCALAAQFKITELELRVLSGRTDLPEYATEKGLSPEAVRQLLKPFHGRIAVAGSDYKLLNGGAAKERAAFIRYCQWAEDWDVPCVRVFGGGGESQTLTESDFAEVAKNVLWWRDEKRKRNWRTEIVLETHDYFCSSFACAELCALLDEPLGIIWDAHHTWRIAGESPAESWAVLGRWIRHVHIKDSMDTPSVRHPHTYVLPGMGQAPLVEIIALLRQNRFSGVVSLEWEKMWHPYLPELREALTRLRSQPWFDVSPVSAGAITGLSGSLQSDNATPR